MKDTFYDLLNRGQFKLFYYRAHTENCACYQGLVYAKKCVDDSRAL